MTPPLSPAMRIVLLAVEDRATTLAVARLLVTERVTTDDRAATRATQVIEALCNIGTLVADRTGYQLTPRGDRIRDELLRDLLDAGKRPVLASESPKRPRTRPKPLEAPRTPKAAATEASADDTINFVAASGWRVCLAPAPAKKKARGVK